MVERDEFRRDLYFRLDVFTIHIPPLRERPADIPALAAYFLTRSAQACNKRLTEFSPDALQRLQDYRWPGNVREMRNVIERAAILSTGPTIKREHITISGPHQAAAEAGPMEPRVESLESMEKRLISKVLEANDWHKAKSAEILGINRTTLWQKIKRYGLERESRSAS
jgi:DNA-binding NtrC family response regulator